MNNIIEIKNATKMFKKKVVFENINMGIEKGQSYGFVGYNGCGKSVFFKSICGFSLLTEGEIVYKGKVIGKDIDFISEAGIIIESPSFINDLSGYKNLKIIADIRKIIGDDQILETLRIVGLFDDKDKKVRAYSLGMKQKLRLAQALMESPSILILDEPTNGLDKKSIENLYEILNAFVSSGGTLLMSSHNKVDIENCCNTVYEFDNGNIVKL